MKATDLLKEQHQELDTLFAQLERMSDAYDRKGLREELAFKLVAHTTIERELFYPELEQSDTIAEAYEEHAIIEWCLQRLLVADLRAGSFKPKVTVLKDLLTRHVEEEEDLIIPEAERWLDYDRLNELGAMMQRRYEAIEESGYESILAQAIGVPRGQLRKAHPVAAAKRAAPKRAAKKRATTTKRATTATKRATAATKRTTTKRAPAKKTAAKRSTSTTKRATSTTARRAATPKRSAKPAAKKTAKRVTRGRKST